MNRRIIFYVNNNMGYNSYSVAVRKGTITITMIDINTDKAVWRRCVVNELNSNKITGRAIDEHVRSIFRKFDPGK